MFPFPSALLSVARTGPSSGTTPTFVGSKSGTSSSSSPASVSLTDLKDTANATATLQAGDFVVVVIESTWSGGDITFSAPSGWTLEADLLGTSPEHCNLGIYSKSMGSTPDTSVTIPAEAASNQPLAYAIMAFRGVNTSTPHDVANVTATGTSSGWANPPAITPVTGGALIVAIGGGGLAGFSGSTYTQGGDLVSGTNEFVTARSSGATTCSVCGIGFAAWSGSGAFDPAGWSMTTNNSNDSWCAVTMALRPADA